jgi:hypothetical protein
MYACIPDAWKVSDVVASDNAAGIVMILIPADASTESALEKAVLASCVADESLEICIESLSFSTNQLGLFPWLRDFISVVWTVLEIAKNCNCIFVANFSWAVSAVSPPSSPVSRE